ncbi:MAG: CDP-diacylglycerol--glycerol-3-phosphate 3-phosphatidyltransferase [bacterium]
MSLPNWITTSRIILSPLVILLLLSNDVFWNVFIAGSLFIFLSLSDALDGYWARKLDEISDLGKILDPLADKFLVSLVLVTLVAIGKAALLPVLIIVGREILITGLRIKQSGNNEIMSANILAKTKTVVQMAAILMAIYGFSYAAETMWAAAILSLLSGAVYLWPKKEE